MRKRHEITPLNEGDVLDTTETNAEAWQRNSSITNNNLIAGLSVEYAHNKILTNFKTQLFDSTLLFDRIVEHSDGGFSIVDDKSMLLNKHGLLSITFTLSLNEMLLWSKPEYADHVYINVFKQVGTFKFEFVGTFSFALLLKHNKICKSRYPDQRCVFTFKCLKDLKNICYIN